MIDHLTPKRWSYRYSKIIQSRLSMSPIVNAVNQCSKLIYKKWKLVITVKGWFEDFCAGKCSRQCKNIQGSRLTSKFIHHAFLVGYTMIIILQFSHRFKLIQTSINQIQQNLIGVNKYLLIYSLSHFVSKCLLNGMFTFYLLTKCIRDWLDKAN